MQIEQIKNVNHKYFKKAHSLYERAFPVNERRDYEKQIKILQNPLYNYLVISDNNEFIGSIMFWEHKNFIFLEHLCIIEDKRNQKYGTLSVIELKNKNKNIIIEVEPPTNKIAKRRINFYKRLGFVINTFDYYQPPYREKDKPTPLLLLSLNEKLTQKQYEEFLSFTKQNVYQLS